MIVRKLKCFVALVAISGCSAMPAAPSLVAQSNDGANVEHPAQPIAGSCKTTFAPPVPVGPFQIRVIVEGTCQVSHLGRTTVHIDEVVTFNPDGSADAVTDITYSAADGDQLRSGGTAHFLAPNAEGVLLFSAGDSFTGGTGRFANVTGTTSIADGFANPGTLVGGYTFTGTITY
jgi:hypothetical protein